MSAIDLSTAQHISCDVAIFGSGIAGLSVACALPRAVKAVVFSKGAYNEGSTQYAQGGIAAAIDEDDEPGFHAFDTLLAAAGIADPVAVATLTSEAPSAIDFLESLGTLFDQSGNRLALTLEGGHSRRRIVHAGGDATGAAVSSALFHAVERRDIELINDAFLVDLLLDSSGTATGALILLHGHPCVVQCMYVVVASGGAGQLYASTTSPLTCTGDGMAVAFRAGAELCDMEFMQFHPTVLAGFGNPRPLISEALRGEGAVLRDASGHRVMQGVHPQLDLAPRDVVSRSMVQHMTRLEVDHLYLDATSLASMMPSRFPTISEILRGAGIDPATQCIPVKPAAHYSIGGVRTTIDGLTSVSGLYAVGEVASVGIHGANRLASNSLLEGVVFGRRIAEHIASSPWRKVEQSFDSIPSPTPPISGRGDRRLSIQQEMDESAGVIRDPVHLKAALDMIVDHPQGVAMPAEREIENANMELLSEIVVRAALSRFESRGAHFRIDAPEPSQDWLVRQAVRRGEDNVVEIVPLDLNVVV